MLWFLLVYLAGLILSMYLPISSVVLFLTMVIFAIVGILLHGKTLFLQKALFPFTPYTDFSIWWNAGEYAQ